LLAVSAVSAFSTILAISLVSRVDFLIVLLLLCGPLATGLKKSSPCFKILDARERNYKQMEHRLRFLHGDLLDSLDVTNFVTEGIDDLDVLDIWDSVPGIAGMFHVVLLALIMCLPDGLESLSSRWTLIRAQL
jgi:hypothetical protein